MHVTMVKKRLGDGSECRKCQEATAHLQSRGLWGRIDEIVWAEESDPASPGMTLAQRLGVERAPFFVVRDGGGEQVYVSVLQLIRDRFDAAVSASSASSASSAAQQAQAIDPDEIGGI